MYGLNAAIANRLASGSIAYKGDSAIPPGQECVCGSESGGPRQNVNKLVVEFHRTRLYACIALAQTGVVSERGVLGACRWGARESGASFGASFAKPCLPPPDDAIVLSRESRARSQGLDEGARHCSPVLVAFERTMSPLL